jgi:hypothetical protein
MCIPGGLLFMWDVVPIFPFTVTVVVLQKKPDFGTLKLEMHFSWGKTKIIL